MELPNTNPTEIIELTTNSQNGDSNESKKDPDVGLENDVVEILKYVDDVKDHFVEDLQEAVAIHSISGASNHRKDVAGMINLIENWFNKLKIIYEKFDMGWEKIDGLCLKKPHVILGSTGNKPTKKTICVYSHLDVSSPVGQDWTTDPWLVTENDGVLYGKGVAFGKGPLLSWLHAIEAYEKHGLDLPINIKFIVESMREQNSDGLENLLHNQKISFFTKIDLIVLCETEWLGYKSPCLSYGCRGTCRFEMTVQSINNSDPKKDMAEIFSYIVDANNHIIVPKLQQSVENITPDEEKIYDAIDYDFDAIAATLPEYKKHWDKNQMLMSYWRQPDIIMGDIEESICERNDRVIIRRKFDVKIVPRITPDICSEIITAHMFNVCNDINCGSRVECEMVYGARPWLADYNTHAYAAARRATVQIYKTEANMIREVSELPVLLMLRKKIGSDILLLPLVNSNSNGGGPNENVTMRNFIEGTKLLIAFIKQFSYDSFK